MRYKRKMNILFITSSLGYGGASKMLRFVAESLAKRGYQVHIANIKSTNNVGGYERTVDKKVTVHNIKSANIVAFRRLIQVWEINKLCKRIKADVVIGFTMYPNLMARLVGWSCKTPAIMSERGDPNRTFGNTLVDKVLIAIINKSSGGVFQTPGAMEFYSMKLQERSVVIPNPIFFEQNSIEVNYGKREKTVVSVGRLELYQKRYDIMLKAFKIFLQDHEGYKLKIYGNGPDEDKIRDLAYTLKIENSVNFMGVTSQPMKEIYEEGIFLITSDFEGISNSLLEAMAVGLPCVSTDHTPGGARFLITDHKNGLLTPTGDIGAIAAALSEFADNPQLAEECGQNAKKVIERFAPSKIIDMWESYINTVKNR